jgi:SsrA-binding protein
MTTTALTADVPVVASVRALREAAGRRAAAAADPRRRLRGGAPVVEPLRRPSHPPWYTPRAMKPVGTKLIAQNKKAYHDYHIEETLEAGIVLTGTEVKSLRVGKANMRDSYAAVENGELWLIGVHISPYEQGNIFNHDPLRKRKLLVHASEIRRLYGKVRVAGFTLVPTKLYFKEGRAKVEVALAKGKTTYDKRETLAKKEAQRDMERAFHSRGRERE